MSDRVTTNAERAVERILEHIQNKKGEDIVVLDVRSVTTVADFFVIATGTSNVHVKAIADEIRMKRKQEEGEAPWHVEGLDALKWVLIDYVDVVVHIFDRETRQYYAIEKLWEDATSRRIETDY